MICHIELSMYDQITIICSQICIFMIIEQSRVKNYDYCKNVIF